MGPGHTALVGDDEEGECFDYLYSGPPPTVRRLRYVWEPLCEYKNRQGKESFPGKKLASLPDKLTAFTTLRDTVCFFCSLIANDLLIISSTT